MNKKIYVLGILIVSLIIALSLLIYKTCDLNKKIDNYKIDIHKVESGENSLKYSLFQTIIFSGDKIKDTIRTNKGIAPLRQLIEMNTIIFRFSKESCMPCLQRELNNISLLEKKDIPVIIIVSGYNNIEMKALLNEYKVYSRYILLEKEEQLFSFEDISSDLFLFMLSKDLTIKYLYFPIQYQGQLSDEYTNYLISLYEKNRES
jgi:hypothetical protein